MTRSTVLKSLALGVLVTSGCQATLPLHAMRQPVFALGQQGDVAGVAIATRPNATVGGLTVSFQGELAQWSRRVLATVADVEKVVVTVKPTGAAEVSQTVLKAAIANGQVSVTFQGLPPGDVTVTITAFDAAGASIGSTTKAAAVAAGQVTAMDVTLQLAPTVASPSGGGSPATGGLATNVSILDGPVLHQAQSGQLAGEFALDFHPLDIALDSQGNAWVCGAKQPGGPVEPKGVLVKLAADGTLLKRVELGPSLHTIAVGAQGQLWLNAGLATYELDADGAVISEVENPVEFSVVEDLTVDALGNLWGSTFQGEVYRSIQTGQVSPPLTDHAYKVTSGPQQTIWLTNLVEPGGNELDSDQVIRYALDGTRLGSPSVGTGYRAAYAALAGDGNMWVSARANDSIAAPKARVVKFAPDGQVLGTIDINGTTRPSAIAVNADTVWVFDGNVSTGNQIARLSLSGAERGLTSIASLGVGVSTWCLVAGSSGAWFLGPNKVYRLAP